MSTRIRLEIPKMGIEKLDRQHAQFQVFIEKFRQEVEFGRGTEALEDLLHQLFDYARLHFRDEEVMMSRHGYPALNAHRSEHRKIAAKLQNAIDRLHTLDNPHPESVLKLVMETFVNHLQTHDSEMAKFLTARGER